jgi:ribose transport system permease protein
MTTDTMTSAPTQPRTSHAGAVLRRRSTVVVGVMIVGLLATGLLVPNFMTPDNLLNVIQQMAIVGVVTVGMTFVILTAGIDLSVGSVLALAGVTFAIAMTDGLHPILAIALAIVVGAIVGWANGAVSTYFKVQPFVMTLATLAIASGISLTIANGTGVYFTSDSPIVDFLGYGTLFGIPGQFVVFALVTILAWVALTYLPFGRYVYAVGGSVETARLAGLRVNRTLVTVYVLSGSCAALAGVMTAARLSVGQPNAGSMTNLDAIAAVVIGGVSLMGGRGSIWGAVGGAFVLAVIGNVLVLTGVPPYQAIIVRGVVILVAVLLSGLNVSDLRARWGAHGRT